MKVLVTGSRDWDNYQRVKQALITYKATIVIHGAARGADLLAEAAAVVLGIESRGYPAYWAKYGKRAGPLRNQEMLDKEHKPEEPINLVLAFPLPSSVGTYDMIRRAQKAGITLVTFNP